MSREELPEHNAALRQQFADQISMRSDELSELSNAAVRSYGRGLTFRLSHLVSDFMQAPDSHILQPVQVHGETLYDAGLTYTRKASITKIGQVEVQRALTAPLKIIKNEGVSCTQYPMSRNLAQHYPVIPQATRPFNFNLYLGDHSWGYSIKYCTPKAVAKLECATRSMQRLNVECGVEPAPYFPRPAFRRILDSIRDTN